MEQSPFQAPTLHAVPGGIGDPPGTRRATNAATMVRGVTVQRLPDAGAGLQHSGRESGGPQAARLAWSSALDAPGRGRNGESAFVRYRLAASLAQRRPCIIEPDLGRRQLGDGPEATVASTGQLRPLEGNGVAFRVVFVVRRVGVGRLGQVVKVRRQRVDEGLQATSLGDDPRAHLIETRFDAVHDAIFIHCRHFPVTWDEQSMMARSRHGCCLELHHELSEGESRDSEQLGGCMPAPGVQRSPIGTHRRLAGQLRGPWILLGRVRLG